MNGRIVVGILFVVLGSKTNTLAVAEDVEQVSVVSVRQTDPREYVVPVANAQEEPSANLASELQEFDSPSTTECQDEGFDGYFRPFRNDPCPCVYFQAGALLVQQVSRFSNQPIVVDDNTNTTLLSTSDLNSNFNPGLQATVGMRLHNGRALEFDYFGLFGSSTSALAVRPDPAAFLIFPNNLAGNVFVDMDRTQVDYSSTFNSFALNLLCCCGCCEESCDKGGKGGGGVAHCRSVTWFAGVRYLNIAERLNISAQRIVGGGVEEGTYNTSTNNNLYGGQLGARLRRTSGRFGWDATGFAGIFGNDAQQTQAVTDFPNFPLRPSVSSSKAGVSFVGGTNVSALYSLTNVWNLRAGYTVLWVEGLALAPNQLDFDLAAAQGGSQIHNGGGMFLHGANVGLEARW